MEPPKSAADGVSYHVSTRGSDANPGTSALPLRTVQAAVDLANAGDRILVHAGTYAGKVVIRRSGAEGRPITLRAVGDGTVVLTSALAPVACDAQEPARDRTLQIVNGADDWVVRDLTVIGGILVSGTNLSALTPYLANRALPGRGLYDPEAAATTLEGLGSDAADRIAIVRNRIRGRGINVQAGRGGEVSANEISDVECGTGGGIVLARFSDGWMVRRNLIHRLAASQNVWMSDGIRQTGGSMYGTIEGNVVEDVAAPGRGISLDVNAGWNVVRDNVVRRAYVGFVEQSGGWGNRWIGNVAESAGKYGFSVFEPGATLTGPDERTPAYLQMRCNRAVDAPAGLSIGFVQTSDFWTNDFGNVRLGKAVSRSWSEIRNTWEGASSPPLASPPPAPCLPAASHVSTTGSDANAGTADRPFRSLQRAVRLVIPGDTVLVHSGAYDGRVTIERSGIAERPLVLRAAGDGPVTVSAALPPAACADSIPTRDRTVELVGGADHWTIAGLAIEGGVLVSGTRTGELAPYLEDRSLPGRGAYDPAAAAKTLESLGSDGADHIRILENRITGRGIHALAARYGEIAGNEISRVACGTGPAVLLARFSDGWSVRDNHIHDLAGSAKHWMSEGIRQVGGSMYNLVEGNLVEDVGDPGRGISTDLNASWNVMRGNTVRRAYQGLSEQSGSWGNQWTGNVSVSNRGYGFNILGAGAGKRRPGPATPYAMQVRCNQAYDNPPGRDLYIGTVAESEFARNAFASVYLSPQLREYWAEAGNTWDGSSEPPPPTPVRVTCP